MTSSSVGADSHSFCISVTFLTGRYHGEEWPPSPGRLYQALVAAAMTCGNQDYASTVEPALRWLENQASPRIRACVTSQEQPYRLAVPNNDMDVVAWEWQQGRHADPGALKTMKAVQAWPVPERGPHVQYIWAVGGEVPPPADALRTAAHLLHTLGWGVDMAFADVTPEQGEGLLYEPAAVGLRCLVPMPGTLDDLRATYHRFTNRSAGKGVDTHTRPSMLRTQRYRAGEPVRPTARFRLLTPDATGVRAIPWSECRTVAAWLRHEAAEQLRAEVEPETITGYVQGHFENDQGKSERLSYVPLPTIYGQYADGLIRRAMIVEPANATGEVTEILSQKLTGAVLTGRDGRQECCLAQPARADWTFRQYLPDRPRRVWRSVTPVVLHGYNAGPRGVISTSKTERLLLRAFEMAGYREEQIESLAFQGGPFWSGAGHAREMRVPAHLDGYPRLHVQVRFAEGVRGPVLAGIGRHYGIGLFAGLREGAAAAEEQ